MKKSLCLFVLVILVTQTTAQRLSTAETSAFAFTHVTVIDMTGAPPKPDMTVVVTGSRITELGPSAGLTPMEALRAATINPAKFFGESELLGTVEQGKIANLILLEKNPLEDIRNTERIEGVVVNGWFLPKPVLRMMLANVEKQRTKDNAQVQILAEM